MKPSHARHTIQGMLRQHRLHAVALPALALACVWGLVELIALQRSRLARRLGSDAG